MKTRFFLTGKNKISKPLRVGNFVERNMSKGKVISWNKKNKGGTKIIHLSIY